MGSVKAQLVVSHIERIPRTILEDHPTVLREYVRGKRGVYALYKGTRLYYVGLATNLRSRIKAHLRDRHAEAWDFFSLYLTTRDEHLRELEALVMRITMPSGNRSKTKFASSVDLRSSFKERIVASQRAELEHLFGRHKAGLRRASKVSTEGRTPTLAPFVKRRFRIRMTYKRVVYKATVLADGRIRSQGRLFTSPSLAAAAISGRAMNGWYMWRYEKTRGDWQRLQRLRRR